MTGRLKGKVALITGAASGIGLGTVELFLREGARVVAADIQDDKGARLEEKYGSELSYIRCDVSREGDIKAAVQLAEKKYGGLDCLFNNAGSVGPLETSEVVTAESFDAVMHLHVRAAMFGIKYAVPIMKERGGAIISTASIAGLQNGFGPLLYSVAKAAIVHMTKIAAAQLAPYNIRVNCICPGLIATPIFAKAIGMATQVADQTVGAVQSASRQAQPLTKGGLPEDIAEAALYLASNSSSFVTGQALVVDGGITVGPTGERQLQVFAPMLQALGLDPVQLAAQAASSSR